MEWVKFTWNPWNPYGISTWNPHGIFHKHSMDSRWIPDEFHLIPWIPGGFLTGKHNNNRNIRLNH
jgi:hypothetical protein